MSAPELPQKASERKVGNAWWPPGDKRMMIPGYKKVKDITYYLMEEE
jgi:hypothetical protein